FIRLKDYAERKGFDATALTNRANALFFQNRMGQIFFLQPPAIPGMGTSSGFNMHLVDQAGNGQEALKEAADRLVAAAQASGLVNNLRGNAEAGKPSLRLDIDQQKAAALGLTLSDMNNMLATVFAGSYVNDF